MNKNTIMRYARNLDDALETNDRDFIYTNLKHILDELDSYCASNTDSHLDIQLIPIFNYVRQNLFCTNNKNKVLKEMFNSLFVIENELPKIKQALDTNTPNILTGNETYYYLIRSCIKSNTPIRK